MGTDMDLRVGRVVVEGAPHLQRHHSECRRIAAGATIKLQSVLIKDLLGIEQRGAEMNGVLDQGGAEVRCYVITAFICTKSSEGRRTASSKLPGLVTQYESKHG